MGSELHIQSEYGKGTRFTIHIKQRVIDKTTIAEAGKQTSASKNKEEEKPASFSGDYRVLLVDDNAMNRKVANAMLKTYNFKLAEADSGKAAIERIKHMKYDMILMDHMMPEMDGVETTRVIIIALTANAINGAREMYLENGFDDFLSKPFDRKQLQDLLEKWVPNGDKTTI